jgi:hypothetical protein
VAQHLRPAEIAELRENLRQFHNTYVEYLQLTLRGGRDPQRAARLRGELTRQVADAQRALHVAGVDITRLPPPAFGGPILHGLPNVLFIHEQEPTLVGEPFCNTVLQTLEIADGYLGRNAQDEIRRRSSPLYWTDRVVTGILGIPAYIVSRIIGVPVWRIEASSVGSVLRVIGLIIDGLLVYFGGHGLGWW